MISPFLYLENVMKKAKEKPEPKPMEIEPIKAESKGRELGATISTGLAGTCLLIVVDLLGAQTTLDSLLTVTLVAAALAIPLLIMDLWCRWDVSVSKYTHIPKRDFTFLFWIVGIFAAMVTVGSIFFHFSIIAGLIFCMTVALATGIVDVETKRLEKASKLGQLTESAVASDTPRNATD